MCQQQHTMRVYDNNTNDVMKTRNFEIRLHYLQKLEKKKPKTEVFVINIDLYAFD